MPVRPAIDTLRSIRDGRLLSELDIKVNDLVRQIRATGKAGSITLKLDIKPIGGDATTVSLKDTLTVKEPLPTLPETTFFTTPESNLSRQDPNQMKIEGLAEVEMENRNVVDVEDTAPIAEAVNE